MSRDSDFSGSTGGPARRRSGASDSSLPSSARLSKMPAETVVPVIATRSGWKTAPGFAPELLHDRPAAPASICCSSNGSASASASRARASASLAPSLRHHLVPRRLVDLDRAEREPDQVADLGQRRDLLLDGRHRLLEARVVGAREALAPPSTRAGAAGELGRRPARGCSARSSSESFCSSNTAGERETRSSENFSISSSVVKKVVVCVVAPAEQREVVAHRLGQVAGVAQLLHRGGAVALRQRLAVGAVQQRQVRVQRRARRPARSARAAGGACSRGGPRRAPRA